MRLRGGMPALDEECPICFGEPGPHFLVDLLRAATTLRDVCDVLQVLSIRWFYDVLIEKMGGGALNPASTSTFKKLMKALSYLMGQRRVYVPKALTRVKCCGRTANAYFHPDPVELHVNCT